MHPVVQFPRDLAHARAIQRSFMPALPRTVGPLTVVGAYRPASAVGGDFYDVIARDDGELLLVVGDVEGHGVSGALWMARATLEVRRLARDADGPLALLRALHRSLSAQMGDDAFVTVACAALDPRAGQLRVANAGHLAPLLRGTDGSVRAVGRPSGPPIPVAARPRYREERHPLTRGDLLLLATDGVTDALRAPDDLLGTAALARHLAGGLDAAATVARVMRAAQRRSALVEDDDRTLLAVEWT